MFADKAVARASEEAEEDRGSNQLITESRQFSSSRRDPASADDIRLPAGAAEVAELL